MAGGSLKKEDFSLEHRRGLKGFRSAIVTITNAQVLALNAAPITLVPAPGVGNVLIFDELKVEHRPATPAVAFAGIAAGEDLVVRYTNNAGQIVSETQETTGWLDQTVGATKWVQRNPVVAGTLQVFTENAPLVANFLTGEITTGTGTLVCEVRYRIEPTQVRAT